jgi:hypothetical protein
MTDRQTDSQTMQPGWVNSKNCVQKTSHCVSCMIGGFPSGSPPDGFCFIFFTSISMTKDKYYLHITILEQRLHTYLQWICIKVFMLVFTFRQQGSCAWNRFINLSCEKLMLFFTSQPWPWISLVPIVTPSLHKIYLLSSETLTHPKCKKQVSDSKVILLD